MSALVTREVTEVYGVAPRAASGSPRGMVRLWYASAGAWIEERCFCRLVAIARPMFPRPARDGASAWC